MIIMRPVEGAKRELATLCKFCGIDKKSTVVEIGCYAGESSEIFAGIAGTVICVDPWEKCEEEDIEAAEKKFDELLLKHGNIVKCKCTSAEYAPMIQDSSVHLVYIDGNHDEAHAREDIAIWRPKIIPGNYISGHDYNAIHPGVMRAVNSIFGVPDRTFEYFSWAVKV
jgi:predicted O-methyltransferase YrrM